MDLKIIENRFKTKKLCVLEVGKKTHAKLEWYQLRDLLMRNHRSVVRSLTRCSESDKVSDESSCSK